MAEKTVTLSDGTTLTLRDLYAKVRNGQIKAAERSDGVILFPDGSSIDVRGNYCAPGVEPEGGNCCGGCGCG